MLYGAYYAYEHYVKDDDKTSESVQSSPSNTNDSKVRKIQLLKVRILMSLVQHLIKGI